MTKSVTYSTNPSLGSLARKVRTSQHMTKKELSEVTGVSRKEVDLFERSLPVPLDSKRRLLKELWARKAGKT